MLSAKITIQTSLLSMHKTFGDIYAFAEFLRIIGVVRIIKNNEAKIMAIVN